MIQNRITILFNTICAVFFYMVLLAAVQSMLEGAYFVALLFPLCLTAVIIRFRKNCFWDKISSSNWVKYQTGIWIVLQMMSLGICFLFATKLRVNLSWDWKVLISDASQKALTGEWKKVEYFARYPNNQLWVIILFRLFSATKQIFHNATFLTFQKVAIGLNLLLTQVVFLQIYLIGRVKYGKTPKALFTGVMGLMALPYYYYSQFAYTDTISAVLITGIALCYSYFRICKKKSKKTSMIVVMALLGALLYKIKILGFIVLIAVFIDACLRAERWKCFFVRLFLFLAIFSICVIGINKVISVELPISEELKDKMQFPYIHWVMMGMNHSGGYDKEDILFTYNAGSYDEKVAADTEELNKRIKNYGWHGTMNHLFHTKMVRTWGNSLLAGDDYACRLPLHPESISQRVFGLTGDKHWLILPYSWTYYLALLLALFSEVVFSIRIPLIKQRCCVERYALLGLSIFLTIWECNSRYLYSFLSLLILVAVEGCFLWLDTLSD